MTDRGVVRARLDPEDRLLSADEALLALNARAGGAVGEMLALPQLASLVRLARRLGVLISRGVTVADGELDLGLWVRAEPAAGGVALAVSDWRERQAWRSPRSLVEPLVLLEPGASGWETDAAMRLVALSPNGHDRLGLDPALLGHPLTHAFRLAEDGNGDFPILLALSLRQSFDGQRASVRSTGRVVLLSGAVRIDPAGGFAGFAGAAVAAPGQAAGLPAAFSTRLERALRSPLGRIVATADSIYAQAEGPLGPDYVAYAADIAGAGRHLLGLLDDLVDLHAIERPDFVVAAERVDLADVARRAAGLLSVRASDAGVTIARPAAGEQLLATGEFRRALQVLVNLIGNAVRYSPRGGTVEVTCLRVGAGALVVVADTGKGIAAEDQARIFDKFQRVDRSEPGGSGLGLYIARRLARAMGGDLTVESTPGQGARFTLSLPNAA